MPEQLTPEAGHEIGYVIPVLSIVIGTEYDCIVLWTAADWWSAIDEALPELLCGFDGQSVKGIGVAGQMHGLVVLDKDDNVIRPTILWNDGRTHKETEYLNEVIGKEKLFEYTGNIAFAGFTAPKIMWLRDNEPENFAKISKIMIPKDYINYLLTGTHCTDYSDAAGMLLLDVKNKCWSKQMLNICGIDEIQMPKLYESFEVVGAIKKDIADKFGINENAVVVAGAGDNAAAAIGTGTVGEGKCNISLGTSGTIFEIIKQFGVDVNSSCVCGGVAKSKLWREILTNILDIELNIPVTEQGPGYVSAMLAMVEVGQFKNVKQATERFFKIKETVKPSKQLSALYVGRYEKYRKIYPAVKNLYKEITG